MKGEAIKNWMVGIRLVTANKVITDCLFSSSDSVNLIITGYHFFTLQHSMSIYSKKLFISFLDRDPKYSIPSAPKYAPGEISDLKPSIDSVELHHLGSETNIVLEGSNLWFCYQVSIGTQSVKTTARDISGSSIQFNVQKENHKSVTEDGIVKVVLHSHFAKPVKQEITANVKPVSIFIY